MSNPMKSLETLALVRDRITLPVYQAYMQPFLEDVARKGNGPVISDQQGRPSGWAFCNRERVRLDQADAYYVTKDMSLLAQWAAASLDETDSFREDLWPTPFGFLLLEEALVSTEMWGRTVVTKAISWGREMVDGRWGTFVVFYTDMTDGRDEVNAAIRVHAQTAGDWEKYLALGPLQVHHLTWFPDGSGCGPATIQVPQEYERFGTAQSVIEGRDVPGMAYVLAKETGNDARYILAILMLMNQTVTTVVEQPADRMTAKRMRRMRLPSKVTVVQLRRTAGNRQPGESDVEWQHRWVVRAFWRWQAYGHRDDTHGHVMGEVWSEGGRLVRLCETAGCSRHWERILIAPYVKGPEGLPLKQSTKVYNLAR